MLRPRAGGKRSTGNAGMGQGTVNPWCGRSNGGGKVERRGTIRAKDLGEHLPGVAHGGRRALDMRMRGGTAHGGGKQRSGTVGKKQPAGGTQVGRHAGRVHVQAFRKPGGFAAGGGGQAEQGRDRLPLRMPGSGRAFMCRGHGVQQRGGVAGRL